MFTHLDGVGKVSDIRQGGLIVIQRKEDKRRILCRVAEIITCGDTHEIVLSKNKNDYFNYKMYWEGKSWVWRVWVLPQDIEITTITNNLNEFPRG